jgi:hypothetical protein
MFLAILRFIFSQIAKFSQKNKIGLRRNRTTRIFCRATRNAKFPSISAYARTYFPHLRLRRYALPPSTSAGVRTYASRLEIPVRCRLSFFLSFVLSFFLFWDLNPNWLLACTYFFSPFSFSVIWFYFASLTKVG